MDSKNTQTQQPSNPLKNDFLNCRKRRVGGTDLVQCQMEIDACPWALPFQHIRFCKNPSVMQFVNSTHDGIFE